MILQPDLHHEGPLTEEFLEDLNSKFLYALTYMRQANPYTVDEHDELDWEACQRNWIENLEYAGLRLAAIRTKKQCKFEETADDRKCIDIMLCILRDFEIAKNKRFLRD